MNRSCVDNPRLGVDVANRVVNRTFPSFAYDFADSRFAIDARQSLFRASPAALLVTITSNLLEDDQGEFKTVRNGSILTLAEKQ